MARRAQQGSVAHCPYCEAFLPQVAAECPACRFPLTMAAADFGSRGPDIGTTSTATPVGRQAPPLVPRANPAAERARVHGSRGHRMRITAWLLGVTSVLLLLAGVGALFTAASPDAGSDAEAKANLVTSLQRARLQGNGAEAAISMLGADVASDAPDRVSVDQADDIWYGVARSSSGRCFVLAARLSDGQALLPGTLSKDEPCTGSHVRARFGEKLTKDRR